MRSVATDKAWMEVFKILGDSNVDLPRAINAVASLVIQERSESIKAYREEYEKPGVPNSPDKH